MARHRKNKRQPAHRADGRIRLIRFEKFLIGFVLLAILLPLFLLLLNALQDRPQRKSGNIASVEILETIPHDPLAYTQGLIFHEGVLLESTGRYGESSLREIEIPSGKVLRKVGRDELYFCEGLALTEDRIFQLTWRENTALVYNLKTWELIERFNYEGEGWGLAFDGEYLYMSDGTHTITVRDPLTFDVIRSFAVRADNKTVTRLNELEWVEGELWANVWKSDYIVRIDPRDGRVKGWIDLRTLAQSIRTETPDAEVLNGIAYDSATGDIFITGKLWPKIFRVKIQ